MYNTSSDSNGLALTNAVTWRINSRLRTADKDGSSSVIIKSKERWENVNFSRENSGKSIIVKWVGNRKGN